jgi:hypothetical protein
MVGVALHRDRGAHPVLDQTHHVDDPLTTVQPCLDPIAHRHRVGGLGRPTVQPYVTGPAGVGGLRAALREPDRPEPTVETGTVHRLLARHGEGEAVVVAPGAHLGQLLESALLLVQSLDLGGHHLDA